MSHNCLPGMQTSVTLGTTVGRFQHAQCHQCWEVFALEKVRTVLHCKHQQPTTPLPVALLAADVLSSKSWHAVLQMLICCVPMYA